jgi:hypothetical protein
MPDLIGHFDDLTDILISAHPQARFLRERRIDERDNQYGSLALALQYPDGSQLYVELAADCSGDPIVWGDYRFQYLAPDGTVRFRYDNAPHHSGLPNFPHQVHLASGVIRPDRPPHVRDLARAIRWHLDHPGEPWEPLAR